MIQTENIIINGRQLTRTYSDSGHCIQRDGVQYAEAIDPAELGRTYTETDEAIETEKQNAPELGYLTIKE